MRVWEKGASECRPVIGRIGAEPRGDIAPRESGQTSLWSLFTRESGKTVKETKQMAAADSGAGAVSHDPEATREIREAERTVSRLQARIVKATREGRWNKVKVLQRLLTHSHSGRIMAVERVTQSDGRKTPGVDGAT